MEVVLLVDPGGHLCRLGVARGAHLLLLAQLELFLALRTADVEALDLLLWQCACVSKDRALVVVEQELEGAHLTLPRTLAVPLGRLLRRHAHLALLLALLAPHKLVAEVGIVEGVVLRRVERDLCGSLARLFREQEGGVGGLFGLARGLAGATLLGRLAVAVPARDATRGGWDQVIESSAWEHKQWPRGEAERLYALLGLSVLVPRAALLAATPAPLPPAAPPPVIVPTAVAPLPVPVPVGVAVPVTVTSAVPVVVVIPPAALRVAVAVPFVTARRRVVMAVGGGRTAARRRRAVAVAVLPVARVFAVVS